MEHPKIEVGILFAPTVRFSLNGGNYREANGTGGEGLLLSPGVYAVSKGADGRAVLVREEDGASKEEVGKVSLPFVLEPVDADASSFDLLDVVIGIDFHWERKEVQRFTGALRIIDEGKHLTAVNVLPLEDYLLSVISSEMSSTSSVELLKAHAVTSRSWLIAQIEKSKEVKDADYTSVVETPDSFVRWWDREDHANFDVCADDHCQRYQGITRASTPFVREAIRETFGQVLVSGGKVCDARFSKCCGGIAERFENVWEPVHHPYLDRVVDRASEECGADLTDEVQARAWILGAPEAFCHTQDKQVLSQVLNDYDQETRDFYRWEVRYTQQEISDLARERLGIDFGTIEELVPVERGVSGRLIRLKVVGSKLTKTIGKELVIRKAFSKSTLYSSAFVADKETDSATGGTVFVLRGAGWGHGVGLCQIGAAMMSEQGYAYRRILSHYFPGAELVKKY